MRWTLVRRVIGGEIICWNSYRSVTEDEMFHSLHPNVLPANYSYHLRLSSALHPSTDPAFLITFFLITFNAFNCFQPSLLQLNAVILKFIELTRAHLNFSKKHSLKKMINPAAIYNYTYAVTLIKIKLVNSLPESWRVNESGGNASKVFFWLIAIDFSSMNTSLQLQCLVDTRHSNQQIGNRISEKFYCTQMEQTKEGRGS